MSWVFRSRQQGPRERARGLPFVTILGLALLLLGSVPASAQQGRQPPGPRVAVLGMAAGRDISPEAQAELLQKVEQGLREGAQGLAGVELLAGAQVRSALQARAPELVDCREKQCLVPAARALQARILVLGEVHAELGTYTHVLQAVDGRDGATLLEKAASCEICTLDEAMASLQQAAGELGGELARLPALHAPQAVRTRVSVITYPAGAQLFLDRTEKGTTPLELELEPGEHLFTVRKDGFLETDRLINVRSSPVAVEFRLRQEQPPADAVATGPPPLPPAAAEPPPPAAVLAPASAPDEGPLLGYRTMAYMGLGLGIAGTALGAVLLGLDGEPTCDGPVEKCPTLWNTQTLGMVMTGLGGGLLASSALLFLLDQRHAAQAAGAAAPPGAAADPAPAAASTLQLVPLLGQDAAGVLLRGSFRF